MSPSSSVVPNPLEPEMNLATQKPRNSSGDGLMEGGVLENSKGVIGVLEVYIHRARDIQNICIYHKQDVYAKICLTDDLEKTVSTQTVNGGGRDPVFNENLRLDVRSIESSLKCEVWMLSRIKNYLQDQLLGFTLIPLPDIVIENGKLVKEFSLTSDDMFHSPTGSIQLTLVYNGASPEVLEIPSARSSLMVSANEHGHEGLGSVPRDFEMIEFMDPKIVNENEMMVSEYYAIPCANLDSVGNIITNDSIHSAPVVESNEVTEVMKVQTPLSSVSINGSPSGPVVTNSSSACGTLGALKFMNQDEVSLEEKIEDLAKVSKLVKQDGVSPEEKTHAKVTEFVNGDMVSHEEQREDVAEASDFVISPIENTEDVGEAPVSDATKPLISVNIEPEQKVVQQDYVDMYMKSMQQFTEALAKMNLPLESGTEILATKKEEEKDLAKKEQTSKDSGPSPRVFYGSRAFF